MGNYQAFESFSCFQKNSRILRWRLTIFEGHAIHSSHGKKNSDTFYLNPGCLIAILVVPPWKYMIPNIHLSGRGGGIWKSCKGRSTHLNHHEIKNLNWLVWKKTTLVFLICSKTMSRTVPVKSGQVSEIPTWMYQEISKWLVNGVYWGYNPVTNHWS